MEFEKLVGQKRELPHLVVEKAKALEEGELEVIVASDSLDRHGEILDIKGLDVKKYMQNPVVLFGHRYDEPPVGKTISLKKTSDGKLVARIKFAIEQSPFAKMVYGLYKDGFMNAFSIGFIPRDGEEKGNAWVWTKAEMIEHSAVPVPANPDALAVARTLGLNEDAVSKVLEGKMSVKSFDEETSGIGATPTVETRIKSIEDKLDLLLEKKSKESDSRTVKLIKNATSAVEDIISSVDTDVTSSREARKQLVRAKKLAQTIDKGAELLIAELKRRIERS